MLTKTDRLRARFRENDPVIFGQRPPLLGKIVRFNRTTATVKDDYSPDEYLVPFQQLEHILPERRADSDEKQIEAVALFASSLLREHGLNDWRFKFDYSTRRAGCCNYRDQTISISFELARNGTDDEITDTLLHEIAHALVGKKHNHDAIWKAKARAIGCSGQRTHRMQFAVPRYHVECTNRCFPRQPAQRRNPRLVCRTCGGKLVYSNFQ